MGGGRRESKSLDQNSNEPLISQAKRCDLCMSFDHFLSLNYDLIYLSSLMLGHL